MLANHIAPWYRNDHRALAHCLSSVAPSQAVGPDRNGWTRVTGSGGTWCSARTRSLPLPTIPTRNSFRLLLNLPEVPVTGNVILRAIHARVRFLDTNATSAKVVCRAFNDHGGAVRFLWNAALKWIRKQPETEQSRAFNKDLLNKRFNTATLNKLTPIMEDDPLADKKKLAREAKRKRMDDEQLVIGQFLRQHPWLKGINAQVRQQAICDLVKAHQAGTAKQKAQRERKEKARSFSIKPKQRCTPSAWTFCLPAQAIAAKHVPRTTKGIAVSSHTQAQGECHTWTELSLPSTFGNGKRGSHPVVYLAYKADLKDGKLLADARFCRNRLGKWSCVVHRTPVVPRPRRPAAQRSSVFIDPGSRTGWTAYSPDRLEVTSYVAGEGGTGKLMSLSLKTDAIIREQNAKPLRDPASHSRFVASSNKQKFRLQDKVKNLVHDAHVRVARDLTARFDTVVLPVFKTQRMVRQPVQPGAPRRKLSSKAARALLTLSHFKFRSFLAHRCLVDGKELHTPGEEYTTKACPYCGVCYEVGGSKTFTCSACDYVADRDEKAAFTYALKCMSLSG